MNSDIDFPSIQRRNNRLRQKAALISIVLLAAWPFSLIGLSKLTPDVLSGVRPGLDIVGSLTLPVLAYFNAFAADVRVLPRSWRPRRLENGTSISYVIRSGVQYILVGITAPLLCVCLILLDSLRTPLSFVGVIMGVYVLGHSILFAYGALDKREITVTPDGVVESLSSRLGWTITKYSNVQSVGMNADGSVILLRAFASSEQTLRWRIFKKVPPNGSGTFEISNMAATFHDVTPLARDIIEVVRPENASPDTP